MKRKKIVITSLITLLVMIGLILYGLADRYLIEHVEVEVESGSSSSSNSSNSSDSSSSTDTAATSDDWNYKDDSVEIHIEQVQKGSGEDMVTYFVADVKLKDAADLKTAFAKNKFGTNIIEPTSTIATEHQAIFAINGDYYGFREDGVTIRNGTLYRDEPARDGLALYEDGTMQTYDEAEISSSTLLENGVTNTFSFGPILVQDGVMASNLDQVTIDTNFGNRSIQRANPRTGIGMIEPNHYVFVVVDGRMKGYSKGMTLEEFAQLFTELGCTEAYNLDGGGSSTMYFMGRVVNNPLGKEKERGVSDVLYIGS